MHQANTWRLAGLRGCETKKCSLPGLM